MTVRVLAPHAIALPARLCAPALLRSRRRCRTGGRGPAAAPCFARVPAPGPPRPPPNCAQTRLRAGAARDAREIGELQRVAVVRDHAAQLLPPPRRPHTQTRKRARAQTQTQASNPRAGTAVRTRAQTTWLKRGRGGAWKTMDRPKRTPVAPWRGAGEVWRWGGKCRGAGQMQRGAVWRGRRGVWRGAGEVWRGAD